MSKRNPPLDVESADDDHNNTDAASRKPRRKLTRAAKTAQAQIQRDIGQAVAALSVTSNQEDAGLVEELAPSVDDIASPPGTYGTVCLGHSSFEVFDNNGTPAVVTHRGTMQWAHGTLNPAMLSPPVSNGVIDGIIPLPPGNIIVFGSSNVGKSPFVQYARMALLRQDVAVEFIPYGEAFAGYIRGVDRLALRIAMSTARVVIVDSFKNLAVRAGGSAQAGGLSKEFFAMLSDLSSFMAERGQTLIAIVNVGSAKREVIDEAIEAIQTSASGYVHLESSNRNSFLIRSQAGQKRHSGVFAINWAATDGEINSLSTESDNSAFELTGNNSSNLFSFADKGMVPVQRNRLRLAIDRSLKQSIEG